MLRSSIRFSFAVAIGALALGAAPRAAHACTGPLGHLCSGARAVAGPANTQTIVFESVKALDATNQQVWATPVLHLTKGGADVPFDMTPDPNVPGRFLVKPKSPVAAGEIYTLRWDALCSPDALKSSTAGDAQKAAGAEVDVSIPAAAPLPTVLGTVSVKGPYVQTHAASSCDANPKTFTEVAAAPKLETDPALAPYADVARTVTTVDGVAIDEPPWAQRATTGPGNILIASCDPSVDTGISPGPHKIGFRAFVAGLDTPLAAETDVDFSCAAAQSGGDAGPAAQAPASSGSSCATRTARAGGGAHVAFGLVAIALVRRRRLTSSRDRR